MTSPGEDSLIEFERSLAAVTRLLADRDTLTDIARRSGHDLPPTSWALLEHLDRLGALRVSAIAACHGCDVSSITPRLKTLENAGLIAREKLPADARVFLISITAEGTRALRSVHAARRAMLAQAMTDVDTEKIRIAAELLTRVADRLSPVADRLTREPDRPEPSTTSSR